MLENGLTRETIAILERCIREARIEELCGFLLEGQSEQRFYRLQNHADLPYQFRTSRLEHERLERYAQRRCLHLAAFVHSHPRGLELSDVDLPSYRVGRIPWVVVALTENALIYRVHRPTASSTTKTLLPWRCSI